MSKDSSLKPFSRMMHLVLAAKGRAFWLDERSSLGWSVSTLAVATLSSRLPSFCGPWPPPSWRTPWPFEAPPHSRVVSQTPCWLASLSASLPLVHQPAAAAPTLPPHMHSQDGRAVSHEPPPLSRQVEFKNTSTLASLSASPPLYREQLVAGAPAPSHQPPGEDCRAVLLTAHP